MVIKGQKINNRYEIIRTIGEGGMANVFLAHDTILDRDVAVKVLRGDLADDEKFVRRFQREAISASSLSHPNIVEMYDVGEDDGNYYIVMEYVNGKTLKNLIKRRGALTISEVMDIMLQLTSGIAHAHDSYIIHRDIKPQNVMILDDGMVKITDFGIAMALNSHELTQTNSVMGSVHYLPPEQANGSGSTIKSDIYSLGILMFELLTGKIPFKGENAVEIAIKQMKEQIPSICRINPEIPQSIENIVLKACAKNPKNRYESARAMYDDIKTCLDETKQKEKRIVYQYPEHELEKTKKMPNLSGLLFNRKGDGEIMVKVEKDPSKSNKLLWITGGICFLLATIIFLVVIVYPMVTRVAEVKIPDVSNKTSVAAEALLESLGFKVADKDLELSSATIDSGKVIKTTPAMNRSVKHGSTITLYVSTGLETITLEDYVGKSYIETKAALEAKGINVLQVKKEVDDASKYEKDIIIEQSPLKDIKVVAGDTVTLTVPNIVDQYPDFVAEKWSVADVQTFMDKYKVILEIVDVPSTEKNGTILSQSRAAKTPIMTGVTFQIRVAQANDVVPDNIITE